MITRGLLVILLFALSGCQATVPHSRSTQVGDIEAGGFHSLMLMQDGSVYSWGANFWGQLGLGDGWKHRSIPVKISGIKGVRQLEYGDGFMIALMEDGRMWVRASSYDGPLGGGKAIPHLRGVVQIATLGIVVVALLQDGSVVYWEGYPDPVKTLLSTEPKPIACLDRIIALDGTGSSQGGHLAALKDDGTVWGWRDTGMRGVDQAGDLDALVATKIPGLDDISLVATNDQGSFAMTSKGGGLGVGARQVQRGTYSLHFDDIGWGGRVGSFWAYDCRN